MLVQAFPSGPLDTNAYVVACLKTMQAAIIDPAPDSALPICAYLKEHALSCQAILLTHSHWDHIGDVAFLKQKTAAPIYIHGLDVPNLEKPGSDGLPCWIPIPSATPDVQLDEGSLISIGQLVFSVIHTPGHTPGSICFYEGDQHILFSGDTLFKGSIGKISFPTSQPDRMWTSLAKLAKLSSKTQVYPGHGPQTTIEKESSWLSNAKEFFG